MVYNQGQKVMDALAENTAKKVQEGKEVTSIIALYQEWLNISDKVYVSLFESEDYTKLMTEVNSLQMKLQKDIDLQMEKSLKGIPVATRSELDELYKTIYDLKRQVKDLERATKVAPVKETPAPAVVAEEKPAKSAKKA
jgi:polyhydroxyalkanoate synthesis regulator phasin